MCNCSNFPKHFFFQFIFIVIFLFRKKEVIFNFVSLRMFWKINSNKNFLHQQNNHPRTGEFLLQSILSKLTSKISPQSKKTGQKVWGTNPIGEKRKKNAGRGRKPICLGSSRLPNSGQF